MRSSRGATLVLSLLLWRRIVPLDAFLPPLSKQGSTHRRTHQTLFYIDESRNENSNSGSEGSNSNNPAASSPGSAEDNPSRNRIHAPFTIPILGPLPGQPPLLIGADLILNAPTPLQWQALEEAYSIHQAYLKDSGSATGIDSAPLVAILDDYTATSPSSSTAKGPNVGRYATIAAVAGVAANARQKLDMTDAGSFMESLSRMQRSSTPQDGKIRLLGIGRAHVRDLFYQVPSSVLQCDADGALEEEEDDDYDDDDYYYDDEYEDEDDQDDCCNAPYRTGGKTPNIVMAKFRLLLDGNEHSDGFVRQGDGGRSRFASPVHALNEMSSLAMKINYLHADRMKLVRGIQAAQIRYERAQKQQRQKESTIGRKTTAKADVATVTMTLVDSTDFASTEFEDDLMDHDGFGALFAQKEWEATQPAMDQLIAEFGAATSLQGDSETATATATVESPTASAPAEPLLAEEDVLSAQAPEPAPLVLKLAAKTNFGMGTSACSISTINESTHAYLEKLAPYYSPTRRETEEHYYEVLSFVAVLALSDFVGPNELGWALQWRNTQERLQQAYDWMWDHVRLLREDANTLSQRLLECGEECTDLF